MEDITDIPDIFQNSTAFKRLPVNLLKDLLDGYVKKAEQLLASCAWKEHKSRSILPGWPYYHNNDTGDSSVWTIPTELKDIKEMQIEYLKGHLPSTKDKFDAFVFWLSENECNDKDKKIITENFDLNDFTGEELLTDVRKSGLFSIETIDDKLMEILQENDDSLDEKDKEINLLKEEVKKLKEDLAKKRGV